jgi:hypothetical protein
MYGATYTGLPRGGILSYQQAVQQHDSIVPIRGRSTDTRPVAQRRNGNFTIRRLADGSVVIRLYSTDIVVYRPNGTIELEPYSSKMTNEAVMHIFRGAVRPQYDSAAGPVLWVKSKGYRVPSMAVLGPDLDLIAGSEPFTKFSVDRSKARAAITASGLNQFALWLKTQLRLGIDPRQGDMWMSQYNHTSTAAIRSLDQPDLYGDIAERMSRYTDPDTQLGQMRLAVYKCHDCIVETKLPYVEDWRDLNAVVSSQRRLG